jgi:hypothetical protein
VCLTKFLKGERIVHLFNKTGLLFVSILLLTSFGLTQVENSAAGTDAGTTVNCAPPTYSCARSDLNISNNLNPPPDVSAGTNTIVTPSDFKLPIVRVTDSNTFNNKTLSDTLSGSDGDNIFNTDDTYLLVVDNGGWRYPVSFQPSTMHILNSAAWQIGTNQVRFGGSGSFSRVKSNTVYAVPGPETTITGVTGNDTTLYKLTLSGTTSITATGSEVFDFDSCKGMANPYNIGYGIWHSTLTVSAGDTRFAQGFSNQKGGQNTGTDVTVYDAPSGQCYRYDTGTAQLCTSTGCVPMNLSDKFTIHEVYMSLDGDYLRIAVGNCLSECNDGSTSHPYFWEIGTTNVTHCYSSAGTANCSGHMIEGYTHFYNSTNWPQTAKRTFDDLFSYSIVNPTPDLTPGTDDHYSNNAANSDDTYPFWVTNVQNLHTTFGGAGCDKTANIYEGCTFPGPLYGEIFGITQSGGYVRAAHSYNSGSSSYFNCSNTIGAVSQTGKFFAWSSDWLTTMGKDDDGNPRCDVFIVNLAAEQGATN